ncbi:MAG: hypothetical protein JOY84_01110 [Curvibacter sp.]|nr:hypothetical protein [Curvibacter sp.]
MNRTLLAATVLAATTLMSAPSFAAGEADTYYNQFPSVVSQRSRAEVINEASEASRHVADVDIKSQVQPQVKSVLTRAEVRQAAASANRAGLIPHGDVQF